MSIRMKRSSNSSWEVYNMKKLSMNFKKFCTKINLYLNSIFHKLLEVSSCSQTDTHKRAHTHTHTQNPSSSNNFISQKKQLMLRGVVKVSQISSQYMEERGLNSSFSGSEDMNTACTPTDVATTPPHNTARVALTP